MRGGLLQLLMSAFWRLALPLALVSLAAGVWLAQRHFAPDTRDTVAVSALRAASYPDTQGHIQALEQWRHKRLVVNFWASWCAPCREEMPDLDDLARDYREKGVEFVGIAIDTPDNVRDFLHKHPVAYPILVGDGSAHTLARQLGNDTGALPYTLVIERDDTVSLRHLGRLSRETLDAHLR